MTNFGCILAARRLWTLPQLSVLGLAGNPLKALPEGVGRLGKTLTELDASRTAVKALPADLGTLANLVKLTVRLTACAQVQRSASARVHIAGTRAPLDVPGLTRALLHALRLLLVRLSPPAERVY